MKSDCTVKIAFAESAIIFLLLSGVVFALLLWPRSLIISTKSQSTSLYLDNGAFLVLLFFSILLNILFILLLVFLTSIAVNWKGVVIGFFFGDCWFLDHFGEIGWIIGVDSLRSSLSNMVSELYESADSFMTDSSLELVVVVDFGMSMGCSSIFLLLSLLCCFSCFFGLSVLLVSAGAMALFSNALMFTTSPISLPISFDIVDFDNRLMGEVSLLSSWSINSVLLSWTCAASGVSALLIVDSPLELMYEELGVMERWELVSSV